MAAATSCILPETSAIPESASGHHFYGPRTVSVIQSDQLTSWRFICQNASCLSRRYFFCLSQAKSAEDARLLMVHMDVSCPVSDKVGQHICASASHGIAAMGENSVSRGCSCAPVQLSAVALQHSSLLLRSTDEDPRRLRCTFSRSDFWSNPHNTKGLLQTLELF